MRRVDFVTGSIYARVRGFSLDRLEPSGTSDRLQERSGTGARGVGSFAPAERVSTTAMLTLVWLDPSLTNDED